MRGWRSNIPSRWNLGANISTQLCGERLAESANNIGLRTAMANHAPPCELSLSIARCSHCPASTWQDVARDVPLCCVMPRNLAFLVNVGANKGYNVNEFLSRFGRTWHVSNQNWLSYLTSDAVGMSRNYSCGACHACNTPPPLRDNRSLHAEKVMYVAVELASSNAAVLRAVELAAHDSTCRESWCMRAAPSVWSVSRA